MNTLVVGGMGIAAGKEFACDLASLGHNIVGRTDTEHPCRVAYLMGAGPNPARSIAQTIEQAADNLPNGLDYRWVMACNTAHTVYKDVRDALPGYLADKAFDFVGNTTTKVKGGLWLGTTVLANSGLVGQYRLPNDHDQEIVQAAIWAAKQGQFPFGAEMRRLVNGYTPIAGCTEMPSILRAAGLAHINPVTLI